MPAIIFLTSITTRTTPVEPRDTVPFPPFRQPDGSSSDDSGLFRVDLDDDRDGRDLSPGVIAAVVVSIAVFIMALTGLLAYAHHRRRKAQKVQIAMKEESLSVTATASGALDPPPPYDEVYLARQRPQQERSWDSQSNTSGTEEEEDSDAIGSHATITDGMEPGRHNNSGSRAS